MAQRPPLPTIAGVPLTPESLERGGWNWPLLPLHVWGPLGWDWLHVAAARYPTSPSPEEARRAFRRIWAFVTRLPCAACREHATRYVLRQPPILTSSSLLQVWAWRFHNAVNARLQKPLLPFETFRARWAHGPRAWPDKNDSSRP
jgi:hypothetical protein